MNVLGRLAIAGLLMAAQASAAGTLGVVNKKDGTASFIDVKTGKVDTVNVGYLPHEIAFARDKAYVTNYGSNHVRSSDLDDRPGNTLAVVRLNSPNSLNMIDLGPPRCAPHGIAASDDGRRVYVTCEGRHEIVVVDTLLDQVIQTLPTNQAGSHMIAVSADESRAYITNFWLGTVSVIDLNRRATIKQIRTGRGCEGISLSADGHSLFVTRVEDSEIIKIDTQKLEVTQRRKLPIGSSPIRVIVDPGNPARILVNNTGPGTLQILSAEDLRSHGEVKVGRQPIGLAASGDGFAFVANMKDNTVSVLNLKTGRMENEFPVGSAPDGIAYRP